MSEIEDKEIKTLRNRLCSSVVFLLLLMYLSMGHMMWGWPLPGFLKDNHGTNPDAFDDRDHGDQSEVLCQRF